MFAFGRAKALPEGKDEVPTRRKIQFPPGAPPKEAELVPVNTSNENWNEYILQDGSVIRLKAVATEIWRILDEYDQDGNPVYFVKSGNMITVIAPENLRRGALG